MPHASSSSYRFAPIVLPRIILPPRILHRSFDTASFRRLQAPRPSPRTRYDSPTEPHPICRACPMPPKSICFRCLITVSAVTLYAVVAGAETPGDSKASSEIGGYDRPHGWTQQSRSETVATHGMVATSHPLASQAGLDVLREGGNAVDAAKSCASISPTWPTHGPST